MKEIKPPHTYEKFRNLPILFLSGSIEMGKAKDWQQALVHALDGENVVILNPRREQWNSSWKQDMDNPVFREQVTWELDGMDSADIIAMYMDPETKSPITLLELGLHAEKHPERLVVCCPEGFWRKGNVDIVCARHGITQVNTLEELVLIIKNRIATFPGE